MDRIYAPWRAEYLKQEHGGECLFCSLPKQKDDRKNLILHRGKHAYVILNRYPYSNGHVMVVCFRHVEHISDLSGEEAQEVMTLIGRCEKAILEVYSPGGINLGVNMGRSAGAGILGHLHVHLVPRWHGDTNFMTSVGEARVVSEDLSASFDKLEGHFKARRGE